MTKNIPHLYVVVAVSAAAILGFAWISYYVLLFSDDDVTKGGVIGTWQNVALLAFGFWIGSSSGGKAATGHTTEPASGKASDPVHIVPEQGDVLNLTDADRA